jgi:hypothetical protein
MLGKIVDAPAVEGTDQDPAVAEAVVSMVGGPPLPHAAWKKVVVEHKVSAMLSPAYSCQWGHRTGTHNR